MENQNNYEVVFNPGFIIKIFTNDYEREYFICINQLVSILYLDPLTGTVKICRGRVDFYNVKNTSRVVEEINKVRIANKQLVKLTIDTSQQSKSSSETIDVDNILEIHPVDWRYPNIENSEVPITFEEWYEWNKKVNAPSAAREDRINASKKSSV